MLMSEGSCDDGWCNNAENSPMASQENDTLCNIFKQKSTLHSISIIFYQNITVSVKLLNPRLLLSSVYKHSLKLYFKALLQGK